MQKKTLVVIGGGAAGFFCAVNAARLNPELEVIIIEKSNKFLAKVRVSGGGRCNVTHACHDIAEMIKSYPRGGHFLKKAFHYFFIKDTVEWFEQRGVLLKTEADNRMFPVTDNSETIVQCLMAEAERYGVRLWTNTEVRGLIPDGEVFRIELAGPREIRADVVCVACGGYPKTAMFDWMKRLGHTIEDPVPSLFTFNMPGNPVVELMGVTVPDVRVKISGTKYVERGPLLITHWGMSGPVILRLSAWAARDLASGLGGAGEAYHFTIQINWLPEEHEQSLRARFQAIRSEGGSRKVSGKNLFDLPQRLWIFLLKQSGISEEERWAELHATVQNRLIRNLCAGEFAVMGKTVFKEEFVTAGGIQLPEIDPATMESRKQRGLFFAGEVMNVDGITGGYNFQHAWTSAYIAAKSIAERSLSIL